MSSAARVTKQANRRTELVPAIPPFPMHRFTVDEYHRMIETGIITENDRVELLRGWVVAKMGTNPPHNYAVNALMKALLAIAGPDAAVRIQQPITTTDSEPEPDVVLATGTNADYKTGNPRPSEMIVLVEVSESSLLEDQTTKLALYAGAKVAVRWIVNLVERRVEVYTQPRGGKSPTYKSQTNSAPGDAVPVACGGKTLGRIPVKELLP